MTAYWRGLQIRMLGGFQMELEGRSLHLTMKLTSQPGQMLLMLLDAGDTGVSRRSLIDSLFQQETETDVDNLLNVTVSRLRRLLRESPMPEGTAIRIKFDRYYLESPCPVWIDTEEALRLRQAADLASGTDRLSILYNLCDLFGGRFLPELDGEDWAETARAHYQRIYRVSLTEICQSLEERGAYEEILRLTGFAAKLFPFDEWQVRQQESLLALGRFREAEALYRDVEKLYLREMDAPPPDRLHARLRPEGEPWRKGESAAAVSRQLAAEAEEGPSWFSVSSFMGVYRLLRAQGGDAPACILCTLRARASQPVYSAMELLELALSQTLAPGDAYTRYSRSQLLAVLPGADRPAAEEAARRVAARFQELSGDGRARLQCEVFF